MIDWSVRFGDLLVLAGLLGTLIRVSYSAGTFTRGMTAMQEEIKELKDVARSVSDVLTTVAVQKNEIEHLRDDIDGLRRGKGYINAQ